MTAQTPASAASAAELDAARLLLARMGVSPEDLLTAPVNRPPVPTFAEYLPTVSKAVTDGTRRVYGSYWNRIVEHWGDRRLDEPTPSEIKQLVEFVKVNVVARRNACGGRSAGEHLIAALHCLYRHAENDKLIDAADNPAAKVAKPRRLPSTRRAVADTRLAEINETAATTGNDPALDSLLLRTPLSYPVWGIDPLAGPATYGGDPGRPAPGSPAALNAVPVNPHLITYLKVHQDGATWLLAVNNARTTDTVILAIDTPVMAIGGWRGIDPALTVQTLQRDVADGKLHYLLLGGKNPKVTPAIQNWIISNCRTVNPNDIDTTTDPLDGQSLYRCG